MTQHNETETPPKPAEPSDDLVATYHTLGDLRYTAHSGRIVLREETFDSGVFKGTQAKAEVSITTYTLDDTDSGARPVTFAFNGGPGSSSIWLHMGLLGPRRVVMGDVGDIVPPPYGIADNHETLLRHSDLVFIDPVSTGYSRASDGEKPSQFHGFTKDLESVAEVIRLWTTRNNRWMSPKFVAGESYGGTRAAALADHLQSRFNMYLNGVILIAPALDFTNFTFADANDVSYPLFLPTYAAIAHYHGLHPGRDLDEVVTEAEEYTDEYARVLRAGSRLPRDERDAAVDKVARLSGLSHDYVDAVDLRIEHIRFFTQLLRDRRLVTGRLDSRFTGPDTDYGRERFSSDPFLNAVFGPYSAAFNHYVRAELGYKNDLHYEAITTRIEKWGYGEFEGKHVSVLDKLGTAMRVNPFLRVHVDLGRYDGGIPFAAITDSLAHLKIPRDRQGDIAVHHYPAGHMMYVHEQSRLEQSRRLADFVTGGGE